MERKCYAPEKLTCEYRENPIGIHSQNPRLAWKMTGNGRGRRQTAYQIIAAHSDAQLKEEKELCWDSKKVDSSESLGILYGGKELESRERVYWRVRIWDEEGRQSPWSAVQFFEAGLLKEEDWNADWICAEDEVSAPHFRKEFFLEEKPEKARVYICGLGFYEFSMNGRKCGKDLLTPNRTDFTKTVYYHTYDITEELRKGTNALGIILGNGWYNQKDKVNVKLLWYGYPRLLFQVEAYYKDGTKKVIKSDTSVKWHRGPIEYNNIYFGEIYDARQELPNWNEPGSCTEDWENARIAEAPGGRLKEQRASSDIAFGTISPKTITRVKEDMYVLDFGQNITGWLRLKIQGKEGQTVTMRFGEELWPDGKINYYSTGTGWKQQKDVYILSGQGKEIYEPKFTWHGFRYAEIQGYEKMPEPEDIEAVVVHTGVEEDGSFTCSNVLMNQIQQISRWSLVNGLHCGMPLDSPHRERQGYGGDALTAAKACIYNFNMENFYAAWIDDFADAQNKENGFIPHTVPCQDGGGGPAWGCAYIVISWLCYVYYGDKEILKKHYENMEHWLEFLSTGVKNGIVEAEGEDKTCLGEWSTPGEILIPPRFVNTYFYGYCAGLMEYISDILGKEKEKKKYAVLKEDTIKAFRREFFCQETGQYSIGAQGTEAFAYKMGAIKPEEENKVFAFMAEHIEKDCGNHLDTGIFGTPYLFETLIDSGYGEIAYQMITGNTYPSYGFMIANGATALWEYWEKDYGFYQCSCCHNQPMFGSISGSFYEKIAGIGPASPAYKEILIAPQPIGELRFAAAKKETMYGMVSVEWEKTEKGFSLYLSVPCNTRATVQIPDLGNTLLEGEEILYPRESSKEGIEEVRRTEKGYCVLIQSGNYHFYLEK